MNERSTVEWREDGRHTWVVYRDEAADEERTVLQDSRNDRAWLDSSVTVEVRP